MAVVVVTSHRSALAFFTSLGFLLCYNVYFFVIVNGVCAKCTASTPLGEGVINVTLSKLHREAKAIFAPRAQRPHERYGAAEKVTPS